MKKVQRSTLLAAAALACVPTALLRCSVHGSSPDLASYDHVDDAGEASAPPPSGGDDEAETDAEAGEDMSHAASDASADGGDGSAKGDSGDAAEEPPSCAAPSGGEACTPGSVACGTSSCTTPSDVCCATTFTSGAPSAGTCTPSATGCGLGATEVACDEASDCASGVCCTMPTINTSGTATCQATCGLNYYQICRSNTECSSGTCIRQSCALGTYTVEACALQAGCTAE